ncbi:MAG: GIY-YIG nuclease family protein [Candidatus Omnitrophica bacterium]|jgi:putative endonuclease|nr:GIY-YIG nuclease family protein [Candidatus Omnitrophota bacterium]
MWYVYILSCENGDLYTGITNNLKRRFEEHASGKGGHFTKSFIAKDILFSEEHPDKSSALRREAQIKGWTRKKKLALAKKDLELLNKL